MSATRLQRLRAMGRDEIAFRARAAARIQVDRLATTARTPRWNRADLTRVLAAYVVDAPMTDAIRRGDWGLAHERLAGVLSSRPARFVFDPASAPRVCGEILRRWPAAAEDATARADRILSGEYDLLGYSRLRFGSAECPVDWHRDPVSGRRAPRAFWADVPFLDPAVGDHKVIWELNRHQHWLALGRAYWLTGDARYRLAIIGQLESWLADNPPLLGINWASMLELGFRSLSWLSALHLLLYDAHPADASGDGSAKRAPAAAGRIARRSPETWLVDLLVGLHHQLEHISRNLSSYFSPNTHLLGEALALYVIGQSLPEMARSASWTDLGRRVLLEQIDRQIEPDGGHAERSLHYHRYTHDFYLLALIVAERCGDDDAAEVFRAAVSRLAVFLRELAGDNGRTPLIGDDDGGMLWPITGRDSADVRDSLALAATVLDRPELAPWGACEEVVWLAWGGHADRLANAVTPAPMDDAGHPAGVRMTAFPSTGYTVVRSGGDHLVFDAGPHGYLNCGHAHADALSVTLSIGGRAFLIDPGTASYTAEPVLRDRMRRTANHNTLCVNGESSSTTAGPFHWHSRADARLAAAVANARFAWMEASHDGYPGLRHRRTVACVDGAWLFLDEVLGTPAAGARVHWHFAPEWLVASESDEALEARHVDGARAWLVHDACALSLAYGDDESGLGWCSPRYGLVVPSWTACLSRASDVASMVTWVGEAVPGERAPVMERVRTDPGQGPATAVKVQRGAGTGVTLLRPGATAMDARGCGVGDYHTNARMLHYAIRDGALASLAIADGTHALALDERSLSVAADVRTDLHLQIEDGVIDVRAAAPPPQLRLQGRMLDRACGVRLNGRLVRLDGGSGNAIVISGGEWPVDGAQTGVDLCVA